MWARTWRPTSGDELVHRRQSTLGDTLSGIPGVNSDTFGGGQPPVVQKSPKEKTYGNIHGYKSHNRSSSGTP